MNVWCNLVSPVLESRFRSERFGDLFLRLEICVSLDFFESTRRRFEASVPNQFVPNWIEFQPSVALRNGERVVLLHVDFVDANE